MKLKDGGIIDFCENIPLIVYFMDLIELLNIKNIYWIYLFHMRFSDDFNSIELL
jgi:hypothetical protein